MIAAVGKRGEIGNKNGLVFHIPEDMKYFKKTTMGHKILMGHKTLESLPKILPGRENYVLTREPDKLPEGVIPVTDLDKFIKKFIDSKEEIFVIGGASVYEQLLPYTNILYLTEVEAEAEADTFFPEFNKTEFYRKVIGEGEEDGLKYTFVKYIKRRINERPSI
ncbi:MAG: dihydrofolate reductase [Candidatus Nanosyncoccaceae bacterium]|jgi:dihydrofolate reductase